MKKLFYFILVLATNFINAQKKNEIQDFFWGANDKFKKTTEIPDKWKNESAVIIHKLEFYNFYKFGTNVKYTSAIRKRIKLLDAAAVKEFSEFSYKDKFYTNKGYSFRSGESFIGVKIVKPDGKEILIDTEKDAKTVDKEKKLAISNLEIGDIIDFYFYTIEPFNTPYAFGFEPEESPLGDVYPTMDYKLLFETENDFFINFNTYNGAPKLKQIPQKSSSERKYELEVKDIEKYDFPRWFYPLAEVPCYKFQVFFARSGKFEKQAEAFLSEKEAVVKSEVTKEDIFNYYESKFRPFGDLGSIMKFVKSKKFSSDEEMVKEAYLWARHMFFTKYIEPYVIQSNNNNMFLDYGNVIFFNTEERFINYFMAFLKDSKIDYDIIVSTPRYNGPIKEILIQQNVKLLLRVNTSKPIYLEYFSPFTIPGFFDHKIENTDAYVLEVTKNKKVVDAALVKLPSSTYKDNKSKTISTISLNNEFTSLNVNRIIEFTGHQKLAEQNDRLSFFDYVGQDYEKYGSLSIYDYTKNKKTKEKIKKELDAIINKVKENNKEEDKKRVSGEFDFDINDYQVTFKNLGRYSVEDPFTLDEKFTITDHLIKKAGNNIIIEVGKFLTAQVEINDKEKERKNNVYQNFPRSFENEIIFNIPEGYTVSGIEKLNKKVENTTGGFISTAEIKNNQLIIKTYKYYANYFESNANWSKMIDYLDAAYQFTQEKILLKKN